MFPKGVPMALGMLVLNIGVVANGQVIALPSTWTQAHALLQRHPGSMQIDYPSESQA